MTICLTQIFIHFNSYHSVFSLRVFSQHPCLNRVYSRIHFPYMIYLLNLRDSISLNGKNGEQFFCWDYVPHLLCARLEKRVIRFEWMCLSEQKYMKYNFSRFELLRTFFSSFVVKYFGVYCSEISKYAETWTKLFTNSENVAIRISVYSFQLFN